MQYTIDCQDDGQDGVNYECSNKVSNNSDIVEDEHERCADQWEPPFRIPISPVTIINLELINQDVEDVADQHAEWSPQPTCNSKYEWQHTIGDYGNWVQDQKDYDTNDEEPKDVTLNEVEYSAELLAKETSIWLIFKMISTLSNAVKHSLELIQQAILLWVVNLPCSWIDMLFSVEWPETEENTQPKWTNPSIGYEPEETVSGPAVKSHLVEG